MTRLKKGHKLTRLGLALAYAGLLVLFACPLATSTLAWFSIGSSTRLRNIEFGFDPGTKMEVQMKELGSGTWIDPDDDGYFRFSDVFSFDPVSNMFASDWYSLDIDPESAKPKYMVGYGGTEDNSTSRTSYATENAQYICLEFRFTSDRDLYIFLDEGQTKVEADYEANASVANSNGLSEEGLNRIDKACRVSFLSNMGYTIYEPNAEANDPTYYGGRLNVRPCDGYWDYDERSGKEIIYGEYDGSPLEYETVATQEPIGDPFNTLQGVSKLGNKAITDDCLSSLKEEGHIAKEKSYTLSELGRKASSKHPLLYVPANSTRRLTVCLYIEGWDKDCDTFIEAATMGASLSFTGVYASKASSGFPSPVLGPDAAGE